MNYSFLLDSGAYSAHTKGVEISIEGYAKFIHENRYLFNAGIFNLDVIGDARASYGNWVELRRLGIDAIPVHHRGDDDRFLKKYLDNCDYIGLGGLAQTDANERLYVLDYLWRSFLLNDAHQPRCRVHGLGLTDTVTMLRYPWFSVDSTQCIMRASFGTILIPRLTASGPDFSEFTQVKISDQVRDGQKSFYGMPARSRNCSSVTPCSKQTDRSTTSTN